MVIENFKLVFINTLVRQLQVLLLLFQGYYLLVSGVAHLTSLASVDLRDVSLSDSALRCFKAPFQKG